MGIYHIYSELHSIHRFVDCEFASCHICHLSIWFFLAFPIVRLAWILSHGGIQSRWLHISIVVLTFTAGMTELLSHLFWFGMFYASKMLVLEFNLEVWLSDQSSGADGSESDLIGWKALEINHIVGRGFVWMTDSYEWLSLSIVMIFIYVSVRHWRANTNDTTCFGSCWNHLGLFIGLLSLLEFVMEVVRFERHGKGIQTHFIVYIYSILNRLILIPLWILTLGYALDRVKIKQFYDQQAKNLNGEAQDPDSGRLQNEAYRRGEDTNANTSTAATPSKGSNSHEGGQDAALSPPVSAFAVEEQKSN